MTTRATLGLALGLALAGTAPSLAQMPPPGFDHAYGGKLQAHLVPYGKAWAKCNALSPNGWPVQYQRIGGRHLYGCQFFKGPVCVIVYSWSHEDTTMRSNTYRHERAHCNGWTHR